MSGGHAHVENAIWMRSLLMAGIFLTIGVVAYGVLVGGIAGIGEDQGLNGDYHDAKDAYYTAKDNYETLKAAGEDTSNAKAVKEAAHDEYVSTHLNYLTFAVAGNTVLVMMIVYSAFIGFGGFVNSLKPDADHGDHDDHGHHGSSSPIVLAFGVMLFMIGFPRFAHGAEGMLYGLEFELMDMAMSTTGLVFVVLGIANWWQEDLPFDGHGEQIATATDDMVPFRGQHIRKVGIWVFLMSEVMVFASFFSSYLRMRTGWCTDEDVKSVSSGGDVEDRTLLGCEGEAFCDEVAPLDELQHDEEGTEGERRNEVLRTAAFRVGINFAMSGLDDTSQFVFLAALRASTMV